MLYTGACLTMLSFFADTCQQTSWFRKLFLLCQIAAAVALIFTNSLSPVQFGVLLWALHTTNLDHKAEVLAACALSMRGAAAQIDETAAKTGVMACVAWSKQPENSNLEDGADGFLQLRNVSSSEFGCCRPAY